MVSLGKDVRSVGGGQSFNSNSPQFFDENDEASLVSSVLISNEEPNYRRIPITWVIVFEILFTIGLLASPFIVPYYTEDDACYILNCVHACYWCLLFIASGYRNYHHNYIQRCGYLEFFRKTQLLQRIPLIVPSLGNTLLIVVTSILQKYCPDMKRCPSDGSLYCHNYLQIIFGIEAFILLACLFKYLYIVIQFNKSKAIPDVQQDDLLISYVQSYAPTNEVGFRDEDYMEEILEKQADMIRYLKQHSNNLSRKVMKLNSQLESYQNTVQRF
ncbi:transmembrane protein 192 [Parasteatoda tepidariorum]|uniref:Transmembrane protein 192 n=1 Tax=Parasteatoda tepidariorum TaxID=114398 RepID=A0A2L2XY87_PARTP|nr:transmembrane protein 192 [Parasteatoda tepidariorum]